MKVEFQNKTYWLRDREYVTLAQLRQMVASDMYNPMTQDKPISYHKVKNYDVEDFMDKYFIQEVKREDIVEMCYEELKSRAEAFLPLKESDKDAYKFALTQLSETFCQRRVTFFIAQPYFDTFNEWLEKFTVIRLEGKDDMHYFLCDFSEATFDVDSHLQSVNSELSADIDDAFDHDAVFHTETADIAKEIEERFLQEFGLLD